MIVLHNQTPDHVMQLSLNTTGTFKLGGVKNSFMVAVEETATGFLTAQHAATHVVSI